MLNRCGYWLFPMAIELPEQAVAGAPVPVTLTLENRGVAPPYQPYELRLRLTGADTTWTHPAGQAEKTWLPGAPIVVRAEMPLPNTLPPGRYTVSLGLFDVAASPEQVVEFALKNEVRDAAGYYRVAALDVVNP